MTSDASRRSDELRQALQSFMEKRGLKPTPWGVESGLSRGALSNFLNGKSRTLHRESLEKLAQNQKVSISELTGDIPLDDSVTGDIVDPLKSEDAMNQQLIVQLLRQLTKQQDELLRELVAQQAEANRLLGQLANQSSPNSVPTAKKSEIKKAS